MECINRKKKAEWKYKSRGGLAWEESYPGQSPGGHMKTEAHKPKNAESRAFTEFLHWRGLRNDSEGGRVVGGEMINSLEAERGRGAESKR